MMNINKLHLFDREAYYFLDNSPRGFIFPHKYKILSLSNCLPQYSLIS